MCRMHTMCTDFCLQQHMRTFHALHSVLLSIDPLAKDRLYHLRGLVVDMPYFGGDSLGNPRGDRSARVPSEVHRFLAHVVWEPVDGQHILWACQHIARDEYERGTLRDDVYERLLRRPATVLIYDDPRFFMSESRRANIHHCSRQRYTTVVENLTKMKELWEFYGQPGTRVEDCTTTGSISFLRKYYGP